MLSYFITLILFNYLNGYHFMDDIYRTLIHFGISMDWLPLSERGLLDVSGL